MASVRKSYISKSVKKIENYYLLKSNILTFDKESKRKSNHFLYQQTLLLKIIYIAMTLGLKFLSFIKKGSSQISCTLSCNKCILVKLWVKVFV